MHLETVSDSTMTLTVLRVVFVALCTCGGYSILLNSDHSNLQQNSPMSFEEKQRAIAEELLRLSLENATVAKLLTVFHGGNMSDTASKFDCNVIPRSPARPTSVHRLTPGDIDVIAALGDSLTAGRAIKDGIVGLLFDFRELSWSIGGEGQYEQVATVPNLLKKYNNALTGYAVKFNGNLNVAISGSKSIQMYSEAVHLVHKLKERPGFNEDWKLITLFIGVNDLCNWCFNETHYSAEVYKANVERALDFLYDNVPRVYVNLVSMYRIEMLNTVGQGVACNIAHMFVCDCVYKPKPGQLDQLIKVRGEYQNAMRELANSPKYQSRDDFTVELQPFYEQTELPRTADSKIDYTYFAYDCFHFSQKGHAAVAEGLWNNMFEPVNAKRRSVHIGEKLICPTKEFPYLYTKKNSFWVLK